MKIAVFCNWQLKFAGLLIDGWRAQGHEVQYEMGYNPALHEWSDVCFVDVCDNNAQVASRHKFPGSKLVIRLIDIECWVGQPGGVTWENVDAAIFGAKHIEQLVRGYVTFPTNVNVQHIPFGVDLSQWTFRERTGSGKDIAFVAHQWSAKGLPLLLQAMLALGPGWSLHILGTKSTEKWLHKYVDHIIDDQELTVAFTNSVTSVDKWLEDKDYIISSSMKETFGYAIAEAAAKGIKPLIHNWYRAADVWPREWIWTSISELLTMAHSDYDSNEYRKFIEDNYSLELMMDRLSKVMEG